MADPMVMIREHRPGFHLPAKIPAYRQHATLQYIQTLGFAKVVSLKVSCSGDEIGSAGRQLVGRRVWPWTLEWLHAAKHSVVDRSGNSVLGVEEKRDRTPALQDAGASITRPRTSARFWSASAPAALFRSALNHRDVARLNSRSNPHESGTGLPHSKTLARPSRALEPPPGFGVRPPLRRCRERASLLGCSP